MTGEDVREGCETILPQQDLERLCMPCGVLERQRTRPLGMGVRALVTAAAPPGGASRADMRRSALACAGPRLAPSAFARGFDEPLAPCRAALANRAWGYAGAQPVARTGLLGGGKEWDVGDSPTGHVRDAPRDECPGPGDDAAVQVHQGLAGGGGAPVSDQFRPARAPDSRPLTRDASRRGGGLLADLAAASLARVRAGHAPGGRVGLRLHDTWTPTGEQLARGPGRQECGPGADLEARLAQDLWGLDGRAMEADGQVGGTTCPRQLRRVGGHAPNGEGVFLPHLPLRLGPRPGADLERVRGEAARSLTREPSVHRPDQVGAEPPCSVNTLLQAWLLAALLAHAPHRQTRPSQEGEPRTAAPRHPRRLAWPLAVPCQSRAQAFALQGAQAMRRWQESAELLMRSGQDPHWRRRPSVVDQLRGWTRPPVRRQQANRDDLKAAAEVDTYVFTP